MIISGQKTFHDRQTMTEKNSSAVIEEVGKLWWPIAWSLLKVYSNLSTVTYHNIYDMKTFTVSHDTILSKNVASFFSENMAIYFAKAVQLYDHEKKYSFRIQDVL